MKSTFQKSLLILSITFLAVCFAFTPAAAQEGGFNETFDNAGLDGWEHAPEAIVSGGVLRIGPGNFAARLGSWYNFQLSLKLRFTGGGETQINFRDTEQGRYSLVFIEEHLILLRAGQDGERELGGAPLSAPSGNEWLEVQINAQDGTLQITVGGQLLINATDEQPLSGGGLVFFSHGERTSEVDDLSLTPLAGAAQPGEPEPPAPAQLQATPSPAPTQTGGWQALFNELSASQGNTFDLATFAVNLLLAVVTSFILSRVYIYWGSSLSNRRKFAANFMLVTVTTTFIILVVRSSVALSLGLVGALSIIRFRAAIKEPEELAYLFFAISLGIGLGDNQRLVTLLSLLTVILVIGLMRLFRQENADMNLHLSLTSRTPHKLDLEQARSLLEQHCAKSKLLRFDENPDVLEMSFVVEFRNLADLEKLRAALQGISQSTEISFLDNKGVW